MELTGFLEQKHGLQRRGQINWPRGTAPEEQLLVSELPQGAGGGWAVRKDREQKRTTALQSSHALGLWKVWMEREGTPGLWGKIHLHL